MDNNRKKSIIDQKSFFEAVNARIKCFSQKIRKIQTKLLYDGDFLKNEIKCYSSKTHIDKRCI